MEGDVVRRRINMLAAHFSHNDEIVATHVLPMNCSGTLNSVLRRCDNKMYFARQASDSLGFFMKPTSVQEDSSSSSMAPKSRGVVSESVGNARAACYARPATMESDLSDVSAVQPVARLCTLVAPEAPTFARPSRQIGLRGDHLHSHKKITNSEVVASAAGIIEWSPRIDVAESEGKYVMTVEVAGVIISDIRVEVDDEKLSVRGKRSSNCWRVEGCNPNASFSSYHKREILYGPYKVVWRLPLDVNKDTISAQFLDGFLQIIIPKL